MKEKDVNTKSCSDPRNWIALFILGTITNLTYVVVGSAAQDIAVQFNRRDLVGLIPW